MNAPAAEFFGWTRRRFWCVAGVLFAVQAGLILLFAEGGHATSPAAAASVRFRVLGAPLTVDQLTKTFFAIDPTVFPLPSFHGFSERAWLRLPAQQFEVPVETEEPAWREIDPARLGTDFAQLHRPDSPIPFGLADQSGVDLEPWPVSLAQEPVKTQSAFEMEGELAGRRLNTPGELRAWPGIQVLSNSVVQIAVNSAGQVIAARLLGRSGSLDADTNALDKARSIRFRPVPVSAPVWGRAVFEWQTLEATNATPPGPP
jgi:hypothetical protein